MVEGLVREQGSPDPIPGAAVLAGTIFIAETDLDGKFRATVPHGDVRLTFRASGFAPADRRFVLAAGDTAQLTVSLSRDVVQADEVVVRGRRDAPEVGENRVLRDEIKVIPGTAGDPLRAMQSLPGVAMINDYLGQVAVRGGGPGDNLYLLDRAPWPVPFHFGGIVSTVNPDLVSSVDLHAGGFGAEWGNTQGAVLDAKTRPGAHDRLHALGDLNIVMSDGLLEGPLGLGDASWTLAGRRTYFDLVIGRYFKDTFTAFPRFWDAGGSLDIPLGETNHVRALELSTDDLLSLKLTGDNVSDTRFRGEFRWYTHADTAGLSWINTAVPGLTSTFSPYAYRNGTEFKIGPLAGLDTYRSIAGGKEDLAWEAGTIGGMPHVIRAGVMVERDQERVIASIPSAGSSGYGPLIFISTTITGVGLNRGGYLEDRIGLTPELALTGGVRDDRSSRVHQESLTPRVAVEWAPDARTTLRAAWGRYDQLPTPRQLNPQFGNPGLLPQQADHVVVGFERTLSPLFFLKLEAYDKEFRRQVVRVYDPRWFSNDGAGDARGAEVFLKARTEGRFFGWISYAYSRSRRHDEPGDPWHLYDFDQPHIATVLGSWRMTPGWTAGAKFRYSSGNLYTPVVDSYQDVYGDWDPIYGPTNSKRLADYARLDFRLSYAFRREGWRLETYAECLNVLGRKNPADIYYSDDYKESTTVNNLPRIVYLGISFVF